MVAISAKFNAADVNDFQKALTRFQTEIGKSPEQSVKWGGVKILDSLRASSKRAKKVRRVTTPTDKKTKAFRTKKGKRIFWGWQYGKDGSQKRFPIYAYDKQQAKASKKAEIVAFGLARAIWGWAKADLFKKGSAGIKFSQKRPMNALNTKTIKRDGEYGVTIDNNLRYAQAAFKTKGKQAVNSAFRRAEKGMVKQIEKRLFKKGFG